MVLEMVCCSGNGFGDGLLWWWFAAPAKVLVMVCCSGEGLGGGGFI
jgi:hypothetical protein